MLGQILQTHTSDVNDKQGLDARINHEGDGAWVTVFRNIGSRFTFRTKIQEKSIESTTVKFNRSQNRWQIKESFGTGAGTMKQSRSVVDNASGECADVSRYPTKSHLKQVEQRRMCRL